MNNCPKHPHAKQVTITFCPACRGANTSERKKQSARENVAKARAARLEKRK